MKTIQLFPIYLAVPGQRQHVPANRASTLYASLRAQGLCNASDKRGRQNLSKAHRSGSIKKGSLIL
jgi:hypothetical protein